MYRMKNPNERSSLFVKKPTSNSATNSKSFSNPNFHVDIAFKDLGLILRGSGKTVLESVTGEIKHGQLTGVMGKY